MHNLTDRDHHIIASALRLYADHEHERATELHRAGFGQTAIAREDLCADALDLARKLAPTRAPEPGHNLIERRAAVLQLLLDLNSELAGLGVVCPSCHTILDATSCPSCGHV